MRRTAVRLGLAAGLALAAVPSLAAPASASLYCQDFYGLPGYGPVCSVSCAYHQTSADEFPQAVEDGAAAVKDGPVAVARELARPLVVVCPD